MNSGQIFLLKISVETGLMKSLVKENSTVNVYFFAIDFKV